MGSTHPISIPRKTLHPFPNRNSYQVGTIPPPQQVHSPFQPPNGTYSRCLTVPGRGQVQLCGIPRLGRVRVGKPAVTLWSATPRYPSSGRGPTGAPGRDAELLSADGCALLVACCWCWCCGCCCCGGRSFWLLRLLYKSNKLVHMVVSAKHTARPWRIRVFILGTSFVRNP